MAHPNPVKLLAPIVLVLAALVIAVPTQRYFASERTDAADSSSEKAADHVVRVYPCPGRDLKEVTARLEQAFGAAGNVRVVPDERRAQILVVAPPELQGRVAEWIRPFATPEQSARPTPPPPSRIEVRPAPPASPASPTLQVAGRQEIRLWNVSAEQFEASLMAMLGHRLAAFAGPGPEIGAYRVALPEGYALELLVNRRENRVALTGPRQAMASAAQLVHMLDNPQLPADRGMRLVSLNGAQLAAAQPALDAIRAGQGVPPGPPAGAPAPALQFPGQPGAQPPGPPPGQGPEGADDVGGGLIGQVQVEMLDGLDVLILRGNPRDVEKVAQIVQQIEQLSAETKPNIEIVPLKYVQCAALATLLQQLYQEIYQARHGTVSILPLVKPNALMLVGRQENVATVVDLVHRLDQPVSPTDQFKIFHLRNAAAESAQATIDSFLNPTQQQQQQTDVAGLKARGQVIADFRTNSLIVRASPGDLAEVQAIVMRLDAPANEAFNEVRIFKLKNSLASELAPILQDAITGQIYGQRSQQSSGTQGYSGGGGQREDFERKSVRLRLLAVDGQAHRLLNSGILTDVQVTADARINALVVTASAESMPLIAALINELDQLPSVEAQIKVFTLANSDATNMMAMLQSVFGTATNNQNNQNNQNAEGPSVRTGTAEGESSLVSLRFAVDARTNSIIASGSAGQLTVVEAILMRLDDSDVRNRQSLVYRLKNAPAQDVANAINQYLQNERQVQQANPDVLSAFEQIEREVVVVAEPVSNSLILCATPRFYKEITELVKKLDERPAMVMIQVLIAQVTLKNTDEFGMELGLQDSILFDRSVAGTSSLAGTGVPGYLFNSTNSLGNSNSASSLANSNTIGKQTITNLGLGRSNSELGYGGLVVSASSEAVSVLIRSLKESQRVDVLSRPQIMTMDNQTAEVVVGQDVPTITASQMNELGGQTNSVNYREVGLILNVTPRISPDKLVVMEIDATNSDVGSEADGIPISVAQGQVIRSPKINITSARTVISAADSQTVVLGGLLTKQHEHTERKVPFLGDMPVLKYFFRYEFNRVHKTELLIIMTPHIVQRVEDAEAVKKMESARMDWCLGDVLDMHDGYGLNSRTCTGPDNGAKVIYPDEQGTTEFVPTPTPDNPPAKPKKSKAQAVPAPELIPPVPQEKSITSPSEPATDNEPIPKPPASNEPSTKDGAKTRTRMLPRVWESVTGSSNDEQASRTTEARIRSQ